MPTIQPTGERHFSLVALGAHYLGEITWWKTRQYNARPDMHIAITCDKGKLIAYLE